VAMNVENDAEHHRFLVRLPDGEGELIYRQIAPRTLDLIHTKVAPALRGRGIAEALAETAFAFARKNALHILVTCPYVQSWLTKHPEQKDLVISRADAD
jgi:predicted GNAT family acetyltransferase